MRQESAVVVQSDNTRIAAAEHAAVKSVARVRRRLFLASDPGLTVQPTASVTRSVHFVETHIDQPITLDDMAAAAGFSKFHFSREFKARTGMAPGAFLRGYRVVRAMDHLRNSTERIGAVAAAAGYRSAAAFSRAFRKVTGSTPHLFRMTHHLRADKLDRDSA
ncbi:MAG: AraC family transcriptional regulator [Candidatus Brocadiia bacterium]|jgi:transcriptional regulator GlxA family with amidase domain